VIVLLVSAVSLFYCIDVADAKILNFVFYETALWWRKPWPETNNGAK